MVMRHAEQRSDNGRFAGYLKNPSSCHSGDDIGSDVEGEGMVYPKCLLFRLTSCHRRAIQHLRTNCNTELHKPCNLENIFQ